MAFGAEAPLRALWGTLGRSGPAVPGEAKGKGERRGAE